MNRLDTMTWFQRAIFAHRLFGKFLLKRDTVTRLMLERIATGRPL